MTMDPRSEAMLQHVHPDLCKVIRAAAQTPQPFIVTYGIRTQAAEAQAVASGHSTTMHSRHLPQSHENLMSCAVDVDAAVNGHPDPTFAKGHEGQVFGQIAAQIKAAAAALNIPVEWGGDWKAFKDFGHFQLSWSAYP